MTEHLTPEQAVAEAGRLEGEYWCSLHERADCDLCDECGHGPDSHNNAHAEPEPARSFIFAHATCWAENICIECAPELAARIPAEVPA